MEGLERSELPAGLRPFAGFRPDRLGAPRPRAAVAGALAADPRLREAVGEVVDDRGLWEAAAETDLGRLLDRADADAVAAVLVGRGRWDDLAVLAAREADTAAARERATAEAALTSRARSEATERRRLTADLATARAERDSHRRRADAAEARARATETERDELAARVVALEERVAQSEEVLATARRDADRRLTRLKRRLADAERQARADVGRVGALADELESLAGGLRAAVAGDAPGAGREAADEAAPVEPDTGRVAALPRDVPAGQPGRPCRLPPGVRPGEPLAVQALLRVPGLAVLVDGYNVTKDLAGRPLAPLAEQRRWLVTLCGGLVARFDRRVTVVFDGTEALTAPGLTPRGVSVVFSAGEEIADTLIVALVEELDPDEPVLVVTADRQVRDDCMALGADVAPPASFLAVLGA